MKKPRLYGAFRKVNGQWVRLLPDWRYTLKQWRAMQGVLLGLSVQGGVTLRPLKDYGFCHE